MENSGECRKVIGAWHIDFAHNIDHDGACLANGDTYCRTLIHGAYLLTQQTVGLCQCETTYTNGPVLVDNDNAFGIYSEMQRDLSGTKNINDNLIARTNDIVLWSCDVHVWLKGKVFVVEDVVAENLLLGINFLFLGILDVTFFVGTATVVVVFDIEHLLDGSGGVLADVTGFAIGFTQSCIACLLGGGYLLL